MATVTKQNATTYTITLAPGDIATIASYFAASSGHGTFEQVVEAQINYELPNWQATAERETLNVMADMTPQERKAVDDAVKAAKARKDQAKDPERVER